MNIGSARSRSYYSISEILEEVIGRLSSPSQLALTTGIGDLDSLLRGGLTTGSISAVAGRPSMGRGEFARGVAFSVAKQGHGVLYFSLARSKYAIALRGLAEILDLDPRWLSVSSNQAAARDLLEKNPSAVDSISELPIEIDDTPSLNHEELEERIVARCQSRRTDGTPIKLVVIDSIECLHFSHSDNAPGLLACMTMLAELAKAEEIHILCTVPVLRHVEDRESLVPKLSDLWGERVVERFCDLVIAIYRDRYYHPESEDDADQAQILVLRNSWPGVIGSVMTSIRSGRFEDVQYSDIGPLTSSR